MSVEHNAKLIGQHGRAFKAIFGEHLQKYMHPLWGFDICQFDKELGTPDGISTSDFIQSKYGLTAVHLIEELLS